MPAREPSWWYGDPSWQSSLLAPGAAIYQRIAEARFRSATPYRARLPVICIGNFTAGGTGKTPMALAVADLVAEAGGTPWFLSRGYGGRLDGQELVDPERQTAAEVGDEPLLLARRAPTVISRDRGLGAEFIARQAPADAVIIMDDGLQNPSLAKDLTIALVDRIRGLGNGKVIPAGPLRAGMPFQLARTDVIVLTGREGTNAQRQLEAFRESRSIETLTAEPKPRGDTNWIAGIKVVAFAGIANPERFFTLLASLGADIIQSTRFADHAVLSESDAARLLEASERAQAVLVTTEKDFVRLHGLGGARKLLEGASRPLPISLALGASDRERLAARIKHVISCRR